MFNILVVEDDRELRDLFCAVLTDNGYTPIPASDGIQAFDILDRTYVDLIISDIMMPHMNGFEMTKALRNANYTMPILMISSVLTVVLTIFLYRSGIINHRNPGMGLLVSAFISMVCGMVITKFISKRSTEPIVQISEATKEIAKGNFDIQINENIRASELHEMAHNFNLMARELAGTEMLRNDFVENVSHEFKTPLTAIEGYVTLLQKKGLPEDKRAEYTAKILHNTKRLSHLTGNILLLSRLENQELEIQKETYPLDEQIREIILSFETGWSEKSLDLDIDLKSVDYCGNRDLLAHVWQNLIGNAIKFVPEGGKIRIVLRESKYGVRVCVEDNGIGMSKEVSGRIYEKFYQGDASRAGAGNGLGLTLVKRIVDLHGGEIIVSSKEGQGSSFAVMLPDMKKYVTPKRIPTA